MANDYSIEAVANTGSLYNGLISNATYTLGDSFADYSKVFYNDNNVNWKIRHEYTPYLHQPSVVANAGSIIMNEKEDWTAIKASVAEAARSIVEATSSAFFCKTKEESKVNSEIKFGTVMYANKTTGILKAMAPGPIGTFLGVKNGEPGWYTLEQLNNEC